MPDLAVEHIVNAPKALAYSACKDMIGLADVMSDVDSAKTLEAGEDYTVTEWNARLQGKRVRWVERETYDDASMSIIYKQTEGDLKVMEGEWIFEAVDESQTKITLTCTFEFGVPMLAALLNPIARIALRKNLEQMLEAVDQLVLS